MTEMSTNLIQTSSPRSIGKAILGMLFLVTETIKPQDPFEIPWDICVLFKYITWGPDIQVTISGKLVLRLKVLKPSWFWGTWLCFLSTVWWSDSWKLQQQSGLRPFKSLASFLKETKAVLWSMICWIVNSCCRWCRRVKWSFVICPSCTALHKLPNSGLVLWHWDCVRKIGINTHHTGDLKTCMPPTGGNCMRSPNASTCNPPKGKVQLWSQEKIDDTVVSNSALTIQISSMIIAF